MSVRRINMEVILMQNGKDLLAVHVSENRSNDFMKGVNIFIKECRVHKMSIDNTIVELLQFLDSDDDTICLKIEIEEYTYVLYLDKRNGPIVLQYED